MIVDLPLTYEIDAVPARGRNARTFRVLDMVPVDLPEMRFSDLDPVVRLHRAGSSVVIAPFGGGMVSDSPIQGSRMEEVAVELMKVVDCATRSAPLPNVLYAFREQFQLAHGTGTETLLHVEVESRTRSLEWSDETERRRRFHDVVAPRLFVMDGHLARIEQEPVWSLTSRPGGCASMGVLAHNYPFAPGWQFRIDRPDLARAFAGETIGPLQEEPIRVEFLRSHDWSFSEIEASSESISRTLRWRLSEPLGVRIMQQASPDFLRSYCVLRDWQVHSLDERSEACACLSGILDRQRKVHAWPGELASNLRKWQWLSAHATGAHPEAEELDRFRL